MTAVKALFSLILSVFLTMVPLASQAENSTKEQIHNFLEVTGFDVALESLRLSAMSAPELLGIDAREFGYQWKGIVGEVFEVSSLHARAIEMLDETLSDAALEHAVGFYGTELGKRLVMAENSSHMNEDDALEEESGEAIIAGLKRIGSPRLDLFKRMNQASDAAGTSLRAIQEVQIRFLMAAAAAGVVELNMDEADIRAMFKADEAGLKQMLEEGALMSAATTYQAFSDAEILTYVQALEHKDMQLVYELMNVVQYEVMAERYEILAERMGNIQPSQDL